MYNFYTVLACKLNCSSLKKILLTMKLICMLMFISILQVSAAGYAQVVSLTKAKAPMKEVLNEIQKQTGLSFIISSELLKKAQPVTVNVQNLNYKEALDKCFSGQPLDYVINDKTIVITQKVLSAGTNDYQQNHIITGKITDEKGLPLPGVSITVKGKQVGTSTNVNGQYRLTTALATDVLVFSMIGMTSQEIPVSNKTEVNVVMKESLVDLSEVVVVGYGTQARKDITGAVTSIKEKDIHERPINNFIQALQGKAAGVYVTSSGTNGNEPGAGSTLLIRGRRSFDGGNDPLYVIDGIPITGGFNDINPDDIVSMEILKDASATAIYGSRGANGVIIVTTRRGKTGPAVVSYNAYAAVSAVNRYIDVMDGPQYAEFKREARRAAGVTSTVPIFDAIELAGIEDGTSTDWQKLLIDNGVRHNHELNVNGGTEKTKYSLSFGFMDDKGYIPTQKFIRYTTRVNLDQNIGERFKVGISTLASFSKGDTPNPFFNTLTANPLAAPYDEAGELIFRPTSDELFVNPLADLVDGAVIARNQRLRIFNSIYGDVKLADGLTLRTNFGPDLVQSRNGTFNSPNSTNRNLQQSTASTGENFVLNYTWENTLNYKKTLGEKHRIDLTGVHSFTSRTYESTGNNVQNLPLESFEYYNLGAATQINGVGSEYEKWTLLSYMGRLNYAFDNKYLITFTARADGSSRFGDNNKWGFFPSAALGWNMINERFIENMKSVSNLKLRLSYGKTGNTGIGPYQTQGQLSRTQYDFGGTEAFGYRPSALRNNDLRWESTASANLGLDFGFLNNRISGSIEYYRSKTTDLLLGRSLPGSGGFGSVLQNVGSTKNKGFEFSISSQNIVAKTEQGFSWSTDLNLSTSREKIVELAQGTSDDIGNLRFIGQPIKVFYDYKKLGIWQTGEEAEAAQFGSAVGQLKVQDTNGNGKIDDNDRVILGNELPDLSGGITNRFAYKRFTFSALVLARFGSMFQNSLYQGNTFNLQSRYNNLNVNYWTKDNPTNDFPQPNYNTQAPTRATSLTYFDGSFVKIKNLSLSYDFNPAIARKIASKSLRIYGSVQDPFTFAPYLRDYNGTDPELPGRPSLVTYTFGINASF